MPFAPVARMRAADALAWNLGRDHGLTAAVPPTATGEETS